MISHSQWRQGQCALNVGLARAKGEVVVALDADTQFNPDTISRLVRWFADPKVGAVAGNAKVGNRINMITRWQALEYIVAQNLERRALSALGHADGGAWRGGRLAPRRPGRAGRLSRRHVGRGPGPDHRHCSSPAIACMFDSSAIAWTEAPATVSGLAKQRFRWAYGTLQCLWKYRRITFNPRLRRSWAWWRCRRCGCSRSC